MKSFGFNWWQYIEGSEEIENKQNNHLEKIETSLEQLMHFASTDFFCNGNYYLSNIEIIIILKILHLGTFIA